MILTGLWFDRGTATEEWFKAFEAYGHAMACASSLELLLSLSLCKLRVRKVGNGTNENAPISELMKYAEIMRKKSLPKLIGLCTKNFELSPELVEALNIAKNARDFLAHDFWETNLALLQSAKGVELIIEQCSFDACYFKNLSKDFEREIGFDVYRFVQMSQESSKIAEDGMEQVLAPHR